MVDTTKQKSLQVLMSEDTRKALGANIVRVTSTGGGDVILDFVFAHPQDLNEKGEQIGSLISRIVLPLNVAKDLLMILNSQLGKIRSE